MSTSLLYHAFSIRGYEYLSSAYLGGATRFHIGQSPDTLRCPLCQSRNVIRRGTVPRVIQTLPIGPRQTYVDVDVQRVECLDCHCLQQVELGFANPRRSYCRAFERYVLELLKSCTIQDVAEHLAVSWGTIKDIQKRYLQHKFAKVRLKDIRHIAIDEIYVGHKHFLTIVLDLDSGAVIYVGEGKGADALKELWMRLGRRAKHIEAVAMDMSAAYQSAVRENLPQAVIVFDHFHLIKLFNEKLTALRREMQREAVDRLKKAVLKGTRWLLVKNPENLSDEPGKSGKSPKQRLQELLELNQPLATAYYLKEDLRQIWSQPDKQVAETCLDQWIGKANASCIPMLMKFAKFLQEYRSGILAWYDHRITTGPLEGTNNKIKTTQRQAYGYRDHEFFKLKILDIRQARYRLVG